MSAGGRTAFYWLLGVGLVLRLGGLPFNGMEDVDEMLLDWGASVHRMGLGETFGINYGVLSYSAFGAAMSVAELMPRFWWIPYKLIVLGFDIGVLWALIQLSPPSARNLVTALFWVNPWFILHEAYHGFWEAPHILMGLLAVIALRRAQTRGSTFWAWGVVGALLMASAMFKPQGLLYFLAPTGFLLLLWARPSHVSRALVFGGGAAAALAAAALWLVIRGGSFFGVIANYGSVFTVMPSASNGGPGLWRFLTYIYMLSTGQSGHVSGARIPPVPLAIASEVAAAACLGLVGWFAFNHRRADGRRGAPFQVGAPILLYGLATAALVISQIGVRAHINHSYTALVIMLPIVVRVPDLRRTWYGLAALLAAAHVGLYGIGRAFILPPEASWPRYPSAVGLFENARPFSRTEPDRIIAAQQSVSDALARLPVDTVISIFSPLVFLLSCLLLARMLGGPRSAEHWFEDEESDAQP